MFPKQKTAMFFYIMEKTYHKLINLSLSLQKKDFNLMTIHVLHQLGVLWQVVAPNCQEFGRSWHIAWQSPVNHLPHSVQGNHWYYHFSLEICCPWKFKVKIHPQGNILSFQNVWFRKWLWEIPSRQPSICQLEQLRPWWDGYTWNTLPSGTLTSKRFNPSILRLKPRNC